MDKGTAKQYLNCTIALMTALLSGVFLPKTAAVKEFFITWSFNPLPLFWCALILVILFMIPRVHTPGRLKLRNQVCTMAFSGAAIFLAIRFGAGVLLKNISISPYDLTLQGILTNLINLLPMLIAREMIRAYALGTACRSNKYTHIWISLIAFILFLCEVNFAKMMVPKSAEEWFVYIAKDILPLAVQSGLLTTLVLCGGAAAGVAYSGGLGVLTRMFPFLPSLSWIAESAIGTSFSTLMALFIWTKHQSSATPKQTDKQRERIAPLTTMLVVTVTFAWFVIGVFTVYPSVILTGSMEPVIFPGDIVLIEKISTEQEVYNLSVNDVITFRREDITITHRIVSLIYDPEGNISFQTKGDNNTTADGTLVLPTDINGIVKRVIPKIGIPVLWLHGNDPMPEGVLNDET